MQSNSFTQTAESGILPGILLHGCPEAETLSLIEWQTKTLAETLFVSGLWNSTNPKQSSFKVGNTRKALTNCVKPESVHEIHNSNSMQLVGIKEPGDPVQGDASVSPTKSWGMCQRFLVTSWGNVLRIQCGNGEYGNGDLTRHCLLFLINLLFGNYCATFYQEKGTGLPTAENSPG